MNSVFKKFTPIFLTLTIFFSLSGCIEITEEASFNKDGSGNYALILDMSKAINELGLTDLKQIPGGSAQLDSLKKELGSVKGISDVKHSIDDKKGILKIGFKFADINALNEVMRMKNKVKDNTESYFSMVGKNFQRSKALPGLAPGVDLDQQIEELKKDADDKVSRALLGSIAYKSIYKFDRKIAQCSNNRAVISKNGKTVSLAFTIQDVLDGNGASFIENTVTFK